MTVSEETMKKTVMKVMVTAALLGVPPAMQATDSISSFAEIRQSDVVQVTDVWASTPELTAVEESLFSAPSVFTITIFETGDYTTTEATAWKRPMNARIVVDINQFVIDRSHTQSKSSRNEEGDEVVRFDYKQSAPRAA